MSQPDFDTPPPAEEPLDVYNDTQEAEYQDFVRKAEAAFPAVRKGGDFSRLTGNFKAKTAKAVILHMRCARLWSVGEIAETLGVSESLVARYLAEGMREYFPPQEIEEARNLELMKLDARERELKEQWDRSCHDAQTRTTSIDEEGHEHTIIKVAVQSGNPALQAALSKIAEIRGRYLGLDMPTRIEVDKTERKLVVNMVEVKSREEVQAARLAGLLR